MRHVVVTGAAGFIGSHVLSRACAGLGWRPRVGLEEGLAARVRAAIALDGARRPA